MKIDNKDALITIKQLDSGVKKIMVEPLTQNLLIPYKTCETKYSIELIKKTIEVKGSAYLCDEILRDESPSYVQRNLENCLLNFLGEDEFEGKTILDFGCGCGSSTVILKRLFPSCEIVGVELENESLSLAKKRADFYGLKNVNFFISPDPINLPRDIGKFDYAILNAVYEHLLIDERKTLLPVIWNHLKTNGVLFICETPYRYYHKETHTSGLFFINYLPDKSAHRYVCKHSKRNLSNDTWEDLLRKGVRGGSVKEIMSILNQIEHNALLLDPNQPGVEDRIDIAYAKKNGLHLQKSRSWLKYKALKLVKALTGIQYVAGLSIAIRKVKNKN